MSFVQQRVLSPAGVPAVRSRAGHPAVRRTALIGGCALAIGLAAWVGHPAGQLEADPALAHLLRGMAAIKALLTLGALSAVLWRFGRPIAPPVTVAYAISGAVLAGSTTLIWQLTWIPLAALLFHAALIGMVCLGWRER